MKDINLTVLTACNELVIRQNEILPFIAEQIGVQVNQVFYEWASRKVKQSGTILNNEWQYFFHGLECDAENLLDNRFIRIDFGPKGATDTFTEWGVLQFIMTSKKPWSDYEELKTYFATENPPYNQFSGSYDKMNDVFESLISDNLIEEADTDLIKFECQFATIQSNGTTLIKYPNDTSEELIFDCMVAGRLRISQKGQLSIKQFVRLNQ